MLAISGDPIAQHGWVLNAARLKRIYLRLLSHFSFHLGLDPSRLLVPDCNLIARKGTGWEAHWLRLASLIFYSLYQGDRQIKVVFDSDPILSRWMSQLDERLKNSPTSSPLLVNELTPPFSKEELPKRSFSIGSVVKAPSPRLSSASPLSKRTSIAEAYPVVPDQPKETTPPPLFRTAELDEAGRPLNLKETKPLYQAPELKESIPSYQISERTPSQQEPQLSYPTREVTNYHRRDRAFTQVYQPSASITPPQQVVYPQNEATHHASPPVQSVPLDLPSQPPEIAYNPTSLPAMYPIELHNPFGKSNEPVFIVKEPFIETHPSQPPSELPAS